MKLISISLSPNIFPEDIEAAKTMLASPSEWVEGQYLKEFRKRFARYFGISQEQVFLFNSGRSALLTLLQTFDVGQGDEVLLQAFTCNAVPNPILWAGAIPRYVDISEDTFNMDANDLEKKITPKCKAIIVQHTFGLPAELDKILDIAKKHKLIVIEDCAHALGSTYKGKKVGTFGDAAFFSFGRDKVISSVYGGIAIVKLQATSLRPESFDPELKTEGLRPRGYKLQAIYKNLPYPSDQWIRQQLHHPVCINVLLQWYNTPFTNYGIGKFLLQLSQASRYLSKAVHWKEKRGLKPDYFPARMPNALTYLALKQFERLEQFNQHRKKLAQFYYQEIKKLKAISYKIEALKDGHTFLRYPIRHPRAQEIVKKARRQGILLGDWYNSPVAPDDTNLEKMFYQKGSCPVAEKISQEVFNLPTNPNLSIEDAKRILQFLKTIEL